MDEAKETDAQRLADEYNRLVQGLAQQGAIPAGGEDFLANPALPTDILREAVPGNIRRAEHFIAFLRRFVDYLRGRLDTQEFESENPTSFLEKLKQQYQIDEKSLKFCYDRLQVREREREREEGPPCLPPSLPPSLPSSPSLLYPFSQRVQQFALFVGVGI